VSTQVTIHHAVKLGQHSTQRVQPEGLQRRVRSFAGLWLDPIVEVAIDKTREFLEVIDALAARCVATSGTFWVYSWRPRSDWTFLGVKSAELAVGFGRFV
jgi:hypothetical protein